MPRTKKSIPSKPTPQRQQNGKTTSNSKVAEPGRAGRPAKLDHLNVNEIVNTPVDEALLEKEEPDEQALAQPAEEWGDITLEDPLEILEDPSIALELSEDPVRLYL